MQQLHYVISYLKNTWGNNFVKVLTLTLGLSIGLVLFARIAFDLSYDRFWADAEHIYQVQTIYTTGFGSENAHTTDYSNTFQPVAPTMPLEIPGVVAGTSILRWGERVIFDGEDRYAVNCIYADTMFFQTLTIPILSGSEMGLKTDGNVFLSESLAKRIFKDEDPIGKVLFNDKRHSESLVVVGTFADVPENSHIYFDIIYSIANYSRNTWQGGDGYTGYVRLHPDADLRQINEVAIPAMYARHVDVPAMEKAGSSFKFYLKPITELHTGNPETRQTLWVLSILATLILVAVSFNYVMISISSLANRARTMAIYKSVGASSGDLFVMSLAETVILMLLALALTAFVIYAGRGWILSLTGIGIASLFTGKQMMVSLGLVLVVVLLAGLLPARLFASIPVTHIFRISDQSRRGWKQGLLGIQILLSAFMLMFLLIIVLQYNKILDKNLGYDADKLVYCELDSVPYTRQQTIRAELSRLPDVESMTFSERLICEFYPGSGIRDPKTNIRVATCRFDLADTAFVRTLGLKVVVGENFPHERTHPCPALVNRRFIKVMGYENDPLGHEVKEFGGIIVGVLEDFYVGSIFDEQTPVIYFVTRESTEHMYLTIRLHEISPDVLTQIENQLRTLLPDEDVVLRTYTDRIHLTYRDTERFRNSVAVASLFMLLITLLGLVGYVADEIRRRTKEIAIRKVNGATAGDILRLLLSHVMRLGVPAAVIGLMLAYVASVQWLEHFPEKTSLNLLLFVGGGIALLALITAAVVIRSWQVANENPVNQIKSE